MKDFYGSEHGEQYFFSLFFIWLSIVLQNCSIGFFLVLDRCLIACYVEMYAKLLFEEKS